MCHVHANVASELVYIQQYLQHFNTEQVWATENEHTYNSLQLYKCSFVVCLQ